MCMLLVACGRPDSGAPEKKSVVKEVHDLPQVQRTTSPDIAIRDLDKRIAGLMRRMEQDPRRIELHVELIPWLLTRAQFFETFDDYDAAEHAAGTLVQARPDWPDAYLARASVFARLHRFDEATADIDKAHALGAHESASRELRAGILQARGKLDEALALRREVARLHPSLGSLGSLGGLYTELGDFAAAEQAFKDALKSYRDVSPLAIAWLLAQYGRMHEQAGELAGARAFYELALDRLPPYAEASAYLAGVLGATGEVDRAAEILRKLVATSTNPEHMGELAALEARLGHAEQARALVQKAALRFDELIARHPQAFADHAARFYLGAGSDPGRAHALARQNLQARKSEAAYALVIEAALQAGAPDEACAMAREGITAPHASKRLLFQAWRAFTACGEERQAADLAVRLGIDTAAAP